MKLGVERLHLLEQPVDQLLGTAHRQRRYVVDRLVRIELGALAADLSQRIDDHRADAQKPELEDLKHAYGPGADDGRFHVVGGGGRLAGDGRLDSIRHDGRIDLAGKNCANCSRMAPCLREEGPWQPGGASAVDVAREADCADAAPTTSRREVILDVRRHRRATTQRYLAVFAEDMRSSHQDRGRIHRTYLVSTLLTPPEMSEVTSSNAPASPSPPGAAR